MGIHYGTHVLAMQVPFAYFKVLDVLHEDKRRLCSQFREHFTQMQQGSGTRVLRTHSEKVSAVVRPASTQVQDHASHLVIRHPALRRVRLARR
jgi:hypothetical protein